jgi:hypothetical protein
VRVVDGLTEEELARLHREEQAEETAERKDEEEEEFEEQAPVALRRYGAVVDAVDRLVNHRDLDETALADLTDGEREALEALAQVIEGKRDGTWYYAEDRLVALNRTLAVLQPVLALASLPEARALDASFEQVRDELTALRERLVSREYAEEELYAHELEAKKKKGDDDDDDDDDGEDGDDGEAGDDATPATDGAAPEATTADAASGPAEATTADAAPAPAEAAPTPSDGAPR